MAKGSYTVCEWSQKYVILTLDDIKTSSIDSEKLLKSINIPKKANKRCKVNETENSFEMAYRNCIIVFPTNGWVQIVLPSGFSWKKNILQIESMLENFKNKNK
ncbi:hypothetical protein OAB94_02115 [Flavobacteriaceae bacterium]|nr:hypothetical protein [Flavobacteriaceae bacterium]